VALAGGPGRPVPGVVAVRRKRRDPHSEPVPRTRTLVSPRTPTGLGRTYSRPLGLA